MALILADRVRETSTTTGTGALSLAGAVVGYQTFSSAIGNTNTCYYAISNPGVAEWEVGIGTYATSGNTLTRTTILKSSNSNAAVNFSAGTKDVFVTYPATKSVYLDASGNVTLAGTLTANTIGAFTLGGTVAGGGNQLNNVIIGTTTPLAGAFTTLTASSTLTVTGAGSIEGLTVGRGGGAVATNTAVGASALAANTSGSLNVAVGTSALAANTSGAGGTAFGREALKANTIGNWNIGVGVNALIANISGSNNIAIGQNCLSSNTTASDNTAVGFQAASANTTGDGNTAIGIYALKTNTTGSSHTAVGRYSLQANTTGTNNNAFGSGSLYNNTTGNYNTAIGDSALLSNTTASNNTAVGYQAGYSNTTGTGMTAVGFGSLYSNTTGNNNSAVGIAALYANTTGANNSAMGNNSLRYNTTGASNTALGDSALNANTTGNNTTAVGYQAGYTNTTGTNGTYLGYQAGYTTTGSGFVGVGYRAGYVKSGSDNFASVMVGNEAGVATTSGLDNTFVGGFVARANTTGSSNTALGTAALYSNTTASNNTAVGYQAGYSTTGATSSFNVFLGIQAGYSATSGNSNLVVGSVAGYSLTTGTNNTFVGCNTSSAACAYYMTTGSKNTILGGYSGNQGGLDIRTASNYIVLSDGDGNPRGIFDSSGNLLVGTTSVFNVNSVDSRVSIKNSGDSAILYLQGKDSTKSSVVAVEAPGQWTGYMAACGDGSSGWFGIPSGAFGLTSGNSAVPLVFATNNTEAARIDSSGSLMVGATSASGSGGLAKLTLDGTRECAVLKSSGGATYSPLVVWNTATSGDNYFAYFSTEGGSYPGTNRGSISYNRTAGLTAYTTTSDYRLKEHIIDLPNALETVSRLKPRQFDWKETGNTTTGFIAHELAEICPHAVTGEKDAVEMQTYEISPAVPATFDEEGNEITAAVEAVIGEREVPKYQGIDTSFLVATLTAAIQEQQAIITALTTRITALEAK